MGRPCLCCDKCDNLVVIAIYDESSDYFVNFDNVYNKDLRNWDQLIYQEKLCKHTIVAGLMAPEPLNTAERTIPPGARLPIDTENDSILFQFYPPHKLPRLTSSEILDFFKKIIERVTDQNPKFSPNILKFVLDGSGSITPNQYAKELIKAKNEIKSIYPKINIVSDDISGGERWVQDMTIAVNKLFSDTSYKLCKCNKCCNIIFKELIYEISGANIWPVYQDFLECFWPNRGKYLPPQRSNGQPPAPCRPSPPSIDGTYILSRSPLLDKENCISAMNPVNTSLVRLNDTYSEVNVCPNFFIDRGPGFKDLSKILCSTNPYTFELEAGVGFGRVFVLTGNTIQCGVSGTFPELKPMEPIKIKVTGVPE